MTNKMGLLGIALLALVAGIIYFASGSPQATEHAQASSVVELKDGDSYTLTASYVTRVVGGREQTMLAYNGTIPGPEIHVAQGATITINLKNDTDMPTLLHSHGVRMDNANDGSQLQQEDIPPGGSYRYTLTFPDAGAYWYHPHANEVYTQALGLYGAFVVKSQDSAYYPPANREQVLFISDLPIVNGTIAIQKDGKDQSLMGHYGNVMLVNGQEQYKMTTKTGEVVRLTFINAANARPFNLQLGGTKLKLVGSDNGAYEKASWQDSIVLGPSERAIVDVMFEKPGTYKLVNAIPAGKTTLATLEVAAGTVEPSYAESFNTLQKNGAVEASIEPFRLYFDKPASKKLVLSLDLIGMMAKHMESMGGMSATQESEPHSHDGIEWDDRDQMMRMMNAMSTSDETMWKITDVATGKSNMDIDWAFAKGTPVKIEIYNDPNSMHPMQHPIHFHGQRFLVVSVDGVKQTNLVWKDTVLVPAGARVEIVLDTSNPGPWMAHCHIAEHLVADMMFVFKVE